ncbi:MAG: hypothetical protein P8Z68_11515 [Kineosporiaceae bacterium]
MTTRRSTTRIVVAAAVGMLLGVGGVIGWRMVADLRALAVIAETCDTDPTASGMQGWCVQTRHRDAGPFTDEATYLYFVAVQDGQEIHRVTYTPFPFVDHDSPYTVTFSADAITVTAENGVSVTYPESMYRLT